MRCLMINPKNATTENDKHSDSDGPVCAPHENAGRSGSATYYFVRLIATPTLSHT